MALMESERPTILRRIFSIADWAAVKGMLFLSAAFIIFFAVSASADYKIGPGDVLEITIWRFEDLSGTFKVTSEGYVNHILIGSIKVAGSSAEEVQLNLTRILSGKYIRNPRVKVTIKEYHNLRISLLGEIKKPGVIELDREITLLDAIVMAGGPTDKAGDVVTLFREKGKDENGKPKVEITTIDISNLLLKKEEDNNFILQNNDTILVSSDLGASFTDRILNRNLNRFYVVGQVKNVGSYPYIKGYTVLNAILDAGGLAEYAVPNNTRVFRNTGGQETAFDIRLKDILFDGDKSTNIEIMPGDLIIVPIGIF
jgi:polysaccharide biosynthesis/export protein